MERMAPPCIYMDSGQGMISIGGRTPGNPKQFYERILNWIDLFTRHKIMRFQVIFNLSEINTVSNKIFIEFFKKLNEIYKKGYEIEVLWKFDEKDTLIHKCGLSFAESLEIPVKLVKMELSSEVI